MNNKNEQDELTESSKRAVNRYLKSLALKFAAIFGIANILALWVAYETVVDGATEAASAAAVTKVNALQKPFESLTSVLFRSAGEALESTGRAKVDIDEINRDMIKIEQEAKRLEVRVNDLIARLAVHESDVVKKKQETLARIKLELTQVLAVSKSESDNRRPAELISTDLDKVGLIVAQIRDCTFGLSECDNVWNQDQKRAITYCVSNSFGERYEAVVSAMQIASESWESAADINFIHLASQDSKCNNINKDVIFDVSPIYDSSYLVRGFFPNDTREIRNVLIDDSSFKLDPTGNLSLAGTLRHTLGSVLGFRNEHTRPEAGACYEDDNWRPLSESGYNSASVMHYPQCNGSGDWSFTLTQSDKNGAACLYGPADDFLIDMNICKQ